jgi:Flp pilus assembly protein TadG
MRSDRGNAAIVLVVGVVALGVAVVGALGDFGGAAQERTRAQTAADAAALASLDGGHRAAARFAGLHGATVVAWTRQGHRVTVVVRIGRATATARATNQP